jgi:hypothetical protein
MENDTQSHNPETGSEVPSPDPSVLKDKILELCRDRGAGKSICPSEVARAMSGDPNDGPVWRPLMRSVRKAAADLQDQGRIAVLRKGKPVDIRTVKGVIRLALPDG